VFGYEIESSFGDVKILQPIVKIVNLITQVS
jgi:hypothetical protein